MSTSNHRWAVLMSGLACAGLATACVTSATPSSQVPTQAAISASPQPVASAVPSPGVATASPGPAGASISVSPPEVQVNGVALSLAVEPPRYMVDQAAFLAADAATQAPAQPTAQADSTGSMSQGSVVLSDMVHATNNIDARQPIPAEGPQQLLRHLILQVKTNDNAASVPYLAVTMDFLLDGRPVGNGQTVIPMVELGSNPPSLYYGNNTRLPQRGEYQVFVRMNHSPLLGQSQPPAAQFNLTVR